MTQDDRAGRGPGEGRPVDDSSDLAALGALTDPVRRTAYQVVAAASAPVGRDDVASAVGIGRTLAAHHLDRLVDAGLLEVSFARRSGRTGPGAGRPAKLYCRTARERSVSVPPRAYRTAAHLLAEAVERAGADGTLHAVAREHGRALGASGAGAVRAGAVEAGAGAAGAITAGAVPGDEFTAVVDLLATQGYEPERSGAVVRLRNCPFHRLADDFPPLVCGMNLALVDGLIEGAGAVGCAARLEPTPDHCCVVLEGSKNKSD